MVVVDGRNLPRKSEKSVKIGLSWETIVGIPVIVEFYYTQSNPRLSANVLVISVKIPVNLLVKLTRN